MATKIKYSEPAEYFPKHIRDKIEKAAKKETATKKSAAKKTAKKSK